jgi:hypothetical protein
MCQQLLVKQSNIKICENLFSSSQVERHDKANRHTSAAKHEAGHFRTLFMQVFGLNMKIRQNNLIYS